MKRYLIAAFMLLTMTSAIGLVGGVTAADQADVVYPVGVSVPTDPDLKNLQWNRYTSDNFTILSIDDGQGKWLASNIGKIKSWCMTRWGFPDVPFAKECRVMCVPNKTLMKKLFGLSEPKAEIRRTNGRIEMTALWLILDDKPAKTIPVQLTPLCFAEFESAHNVKMPFFAVKGMSYLNSPVADIRQQLGKLTEIINKDSPVFVSEKMFTMTEDDYSKLKADDQKVFDAQTVALCLLLRKEFGEAKLQGFLRMSNRNKTEDVIRVVYGFRSFQHFDSSYARYMKDLTNDILRSKTPDSYLTIVPVPR
jgi:hypothetical protein